jgi:formylglycine-generating enzyme required for sulfatase activity
MVIAVAGLVGCSQSEQPPNDPSVSTTPVPVAAAKDLLTDLARWDGATSESRRAAAEDTARRLPDFTLLGLETFSSGGQTHEVAIYRHEKTTLEFVLVPAGTFVMGAPDSDLTPVEKFDDGATQHTVTLTQPFLIARTPCTQAAYELIVGANPSKVKGQSLPVEYIDWDDAYEFCARAGFALPTEAQWEYACRAGTTTKWFCGDDETQLAEFGWPRDEEQTNRNESVLHAVGQKKPNAFGLFDLFGNGGQWCADYRDRYPAGPVTDPTGPQEPTMWRVYRGGHFPTGHYARSGARYADPPDLAANAFGFRPVRSAAPEEIPRASIPPASVVPDPLTDLAHWDAATSESRRAAADEARRRVPGFAFSRMETFSCGGQTHEVAIFVHTRTATEYVLVPAGVFRMGSPEGQHLHPLLPEKEHRVRLTRPFLIARTEVTTATWKAVMESKWSRLGPEFPVSGIPWLKASAFCDRAGLALPTEAQWEFACRAGTTGRFCCGDDVDALPEYAWSAANSGREVRPVAQKKPNALGLFDMHGNVDEFCADWYDDYPPTPVIDPTGPPSPGDRVQFRVVRGGALTTDAVYLRSAVRSCKLPDLDGGFTGLRPALTIP